MSSSVVRLGGVDGFQLWGFLSAVGVLRCYADTDQGTEVRLSWDDTGNPLYHFTAQANVPDVLAVLQRSVERFGDRTVVPGWRERTVSPAHQSGAETKKKQATVRGFGRVKAVNGPGDADGYETASLWNPWATVRTHDGDAVYAPARWARNSPNNIDFDLHRSVDDAVSVLIERKWKVDRGLGEQPLNGTQIRARWAELTGARKISLSRDWREHTGVPAPKSASSSLLLMEHRSKHGYGVESTSSPTQDGISTTVSFQYAPSITFLMGMGLLSITAYGGEVPGESSGGKGNGDTRLVRWALWRQPLSLPAITYLLWHPGLDSPHAEVRRTLCGGHPSPLHAALLYQAEGAKGIAPPSKTKARKGVR